MATENFTTYTEVDPNNRLSETVSTVTATNIHWNEDCYLYYDKTVGHFGDFEHLFHSKLTESIDRGGHCFWGVGNDLDDIEGWTTGIEVHVDVAVGSAQNSWSFRQREIVEFDDTALANIGIDRWFTAKRDGTTGTLEIYNDAARTDLYDTLNIIAPTTTYRYIYGCCSRFIGALDRDSSGFTADLDLQEVGLPMGLGLKLAMKGSIGRPPLGTGGASFGG